jgi:hypothetical protein
VCCAGTYDDQGCQLDVKAHRGDGGGASTSYQRVLSVMGVVWHGDVQGALGIALATRIEEEPGDGASDALIRVPLSGMWQQRQQLYCLHY